MNTEQVRSLLLKLEPKVKPFTLVFSGKKSKKVHGLYKPDSAEIIIHNRNFSTEDGIIYTAIHEFAHHIHFTSSAVPVSQRSHTTVFWSILHNLLDKAEKGGLYKNLFRTEKDFLDLTEKIRKSFLSPNGHLMKELGSVLLKAEELCRRHRVSFDDYTDRELGLHRSVARTIMKLTSMDLDPEIGYENMKIVSGIKDPHKVQEAQEAFRQGKSPDRVKMDFRTEEKEDQSEITILLAEKKRLNDTMERIKKRLKDIEDRIKKSGSGKS